MKTCPKCHKKKPFSEFYKRQVSKDGLQRTCKTCMNKLTVNLNDVFFGMSPDEMVGITKINNKYKYVKIYKVAFDRH